MKAKEPVCIHVTSVGVEALLVSEDPEQIGDQQAEGGGGSYIQVRYTSERLLWRTGKECVST